MELINWWQRLGLHSWTFRHLSHFETPFFLILYESCTAFMSVNGTRGELYMKGSNGVPHSLPGWIGNIKRLNSEQPEEANCFCHPQTFFPSPLPTSLRAIRGSAFSQWPLANCVSSQCTINTTCSRCFQVLNHNIVSVVKDTSLGCQTRGSTLTSRWLSEPLWIDCASSAQSTVVMRTFITLASVALKFSKGKGS